MAAATVTEQVGPSIFSFCISLLYRVVFVLSVDLREPLSSSGSKDMPQVEMADLRPVVTASSRNSQ